MKKRAMRFLLSGYLQRFVFFMSRRTAFRQRAVTEKRSDIQRRGSDVYDAFRLSVCA